jgi:2-polyprenyl-6-methoxyphenol hydroxylase-like FAD-dependent oxidoreductase
VLADVVDEVVVLERERLPSDAVARGHVPQGRHLHLLLSAGLRLMEEWFPAVEEELVALGAVRVDGTRAWVYQSGGYRVRGDWGRPVVSMTRPLLEQVLRRRVEELANVRVEEGVLVERVEVSDGRVAGVVVAGELRTAGLVVDCSGRSSRIAHQLESSGQLAPPVDHVRIDCAYTSGFLPRTDHDVDGSFVVCGTSPPTSFRAGAALPVEGDRWMVTLAGVHGDAPGSTEEEVLAFARSLPSPAVGELVAGLGPLSAVATYRYPSSQRRRYERAPRLLGGFVTLGDAACSFDPIYGQGMSCAAQQAAALGGTIRDVGLGSDDLPRTFHRRAARVIDAPWAIAVGADFLHPETTGPKAPGTDLANRYVQRLIRGTHSSIGLARSFNQVVNLVEPTSALGRPSVLARVIAAELRGRRRRPEVRHPVVSPPAP